MYLRVSTAYSGIAVAKVESRRMVTLAAAGLRTEPMGDEALPSMFAAAAGGLLVG